MIDALRTTYSNSGVAAAHSLSQAPVCVCQCHHLVCVSFLGLQSVDQRWCVCGGGVCAHVSGLTGVVS